MLYPDFAIFDIDVHTAPVMDQRNSFSPSLSLSPLRVSEEKFRGI
jgi:hypothetical protein